MSISSCKYLSNAGCNLISTLRNSGKEKMERNYCVVIDDRSWRQESRNGWARVDERMLDRARDEDRELKIEVGKGDRQFSQTDRSRLAAHASYM